MSQVYKADRSKIKSPSLVRDSLRDCIRERSALPFDAPPPLATPEPPPIGFASWLEFDARCQKKMREVLDDLPPLPHGYVWGPKGELIERGIDGRRDICIVPHPFIMSDQQWVGHEHFVSCWAHRRNWRYERLFRLPAHQAFACQRRLFARFGVEVCDINALRKYLCAAFAKLVSEDTAHHERRNFHDERRRDRAEQWENEIRWTRVAISLQREIDRLHEGHVS